MRGSRAALLRAVGAIFAVATDLFPQTAAAQPDPQGAPTKDPPAAEPSPPSAPAPPDKPAIDPNNPSKLLPKDASSAPASPDASPDTKADATPSAPPSAPAPPTLPAVPSTASPPAATGAFNFGSYGRVIAATDGRGGPGRDADIVAHGSRLDESNYVELELRRDDTWRITSASTRIVATLAIGNPIFHYNGEFDVKMAVRNLYIEEKGLISPDLSVWAGSRMYRGDDIYLLDYWPLDNLNTIGAGARYAIGERTHVAVQGGLSQPKSLFFKQEVDRPSPLNGFGAYKVSILDRQKFIGSVKASHIIPISEKGGVKLVAYGEAHALPAGQKETDTGVFEKLPSDDGGVIGAQIGLFTGQRDVHVNLFFRYAGGLAAYGDFSSPFALATDRTSTGAREILGALGANWEAGPFGVLAGAYIRSFRNASPDLDYDDVDEGIIAVRPHLFFGEIGGIAAELSYEAMQRGVLSVPAQIPGAVPPAGAPTGPLSASVTRVGVIPFLSPAGRGDFSRPQIRILYVASIRSDGARALYPQDDVFNLRKVEHFFGVGAEWWFNSSYGD